MTTAPTTRDCFDRLAKVGIGDGLEPPRPSYSLWTLHDGMFRCPLPERAVEALLCDAVLREHPWWTCVGMEGANYGVHDHYDQVDIVPAVYPTRLAALTLAAERGEEKAQ